jgi:glycerophosphoryl diester phosphodiesterase
MHSIKIIPPVIAHRGASAYAPENTLSSFLKAKQLGINWVEFDVMLSADDRVIVIHDETIDRTTNGSGKVSELTWPFLQTLDAGTWFDPVFSGEKIPLLSDVIKLLNQYQLNANIEIKDLADRAELTVNKVLEVIEDHWDKNMNLPLISSFSLEVTQYVRKYSKTAKLGFLMREWLPDWQALCDQLNCISVHVNEKILTEERVKRIRSTDRAVLSYTINHRDRAQELFNWGVDAVFSDCPDKILFSEPLRGK